MEFRDMIEELKGTTLKKEKEHILDYFINDEEWGEYFCGLLREAFDPNILHHVVIRKKDIPGSGMFTLGELRSEVDALFHRLHGELSSAKNRSSVRKVMDGLMEEDQRILMGIVNKRLRCGVQIKTINKVRPDTIQVTPIALAKKYEPDKFHLYSPQFFWSNKLDGQRVFALRTSEGWSKHSRAGDYLGNKIRTLDHWDEELEHYYNKTGMNFLDGEAYKHGMTFEEISSLVSSSVNRKDATPLEYHIFFSGKTMSIAQSATSNQINGIPPDRTFEVFNRYEKLVGVRQILTINAKERIYDLIDKAVEQGYEGVMLRSSEKTYDFKRGNYLLKAKQSDLAGVIETVDAQVEDIEYGDIVTRDTGEEKIENLPVALVVSVPSIMHTMKVGSGFSLEDRRAWMEDETLIIYKTIEVECQGFGANNRMRFPTYKRVRSDV